MPDGSRLLFRVAAGPRIGFGHPVRTVSLARTIGERPVVSLRGGAVARAAARRLECTLTERSATEALSSYAPEILVIDDPRASAAAPWIVAARRQAIPVAAIVDRGVGAHDTDLVIDGGLQGRTGRAQGRRCLCGPRYMVLDPTFLTARRHRRQRTGSGTVAIVLGGGAHARYATRVAAELSSILGSASVRLALGFAVRDAPAAEKRQAHTALLAEADVALVAGGVGLYEACCLGTPTIAVAVTPAQRGAIRAFARLGAVVDAGSLGAGDDPAAAGRLVKSVERLLGDLRRRARLSARARRIVDGRGGLRVAGALRHLARSPKAFGGGLS